VVVSILSHPVELVHGAEGDELVIYHLLTPDVALPRQQCHAVLPQDLLEDRDRSPLGDVAQVCLSFTRGVVRPLQQRGDVSQLLCSCILLHVLLVESSAVIHACLSGQKH